MRHILTRALSLFAAALLGAFSTLLLLPGGESAGDAAATGAPAGVDYGAAAPVFARDADGDAAFSLSPAVTAPPDRAAEPSPPPSEQSIFWPDAPTPAPSAPASQTPGFDIELLAPASGAPPKRVLIYHTHTYEAYAQAADASYRETERWRTADNQYNVVRVGAELAGLLRALGLDVTHDATAFEPPTLSGAYNRSLTMLEKRIGEGDRYDLYLDLHRDAYIPSQAGSNTVVIGGAEVAKLMLLVGKGEGQTTQGFSQRPDWERNLALAQAVTDALGAQADGLCKSVRLKSGRFNQHVDKGCLLVEVGNNENSLVEALAAMPYLADAVAEVLLDKSGQN